MTVVMRRVLAISLLLFACDKAEAEPASAVAKGEEPEPESKAKTKTKAKAKAKSTSKAKPSDPPTAGLGAQVQTAVDDAKDPPLPPEEIIATVGETKIRKATFHAIYDLKVKKYADRGREVPQTADRRYRKSILERLTYHEVLKQEAARKRVSFDAAELKARVEQQQRGITDWAKHLERRGETEQSLEAMYISELLEKALIEAAGKLAVSKTELEAEYAKVKDDWKSDKDRYRASHILVTIGTPTSEAAAEATAEEIHTEATKPGADFAALARARSTGPSASKGGDIGIFTKDRMAEEFSDATAALSIGEISKPVKTKFGFHIIKLTGKWPPGTLPLDALEDQLTAKLRQRKLHENRRKLKEDLTSAAEILWFIDVDTGEPRPKGVKP